MDAHPIRVRLACAAEAPALAVFAAMTFPLACPPGADPEAVARHIATELDAAHFEAWATSADHLLLLAERAPAGAGGTGGTGGAQASGERLGYALLARGRPATATPETVVGFPLELSKIYVHPSVMGTGVAGDLMRAVLDGARSRFRATSLWLGTNKANARARAFYARHGFRVVGRRTFMLGDQMHDDVVMVRPL